MVAGVPGYLGRVVMARALAPVVAALIPAATHYLVLGGLAVAAVVLGEVAEQALLLQLLVFVPVPPEMAAQAAFMVVALVDKEVLSLLLMGPTALVVAEQSA